MSRVAMMEWILHKRNDVTYGIKNWSMSVEDVSYGGDQSAS